MPTKPVAKGLGLAVFVALLVPVLLAIVLVATIHTKVSVLSGPEDFQQMRMQPKPNHAHRPRWYPRVALSRIL